MQGEKPKKTRKGIKDRAIPLSKKEMAIVEAYLTNSFKKKDAMLSVGVPASRAQEQAYQFFSRPEVDSYINKRLEEMKLGADSVLKMIGDIARTNLGEFITEKEVIVTEPLEITVREYIKRLKAKREDKLTYLNAASHLMGGSEVELIQGEINELDKEIIKQEITAKRNIKTKVVIQSEPKVVKAADLDLLKLAAAKDAGRIKSFTPTQYGAKVEMLSADTALYKLAQAHGLITDKGNFDPKKAPPVELTAEQARAIKKAFEEKY